MPHLIFCHFSVSSQLRPRLCLLSCLPHGFPKLTRVIRWANGEEAQGTFRTAFPSLLILFNVCHQLDPSLTSTRMPSGVFLAAVWKDMSREKNVNTSRVDQSHKRLMTSVVSCILYHVMRWDHSLRFLLRDSSAYCHRRSFVLVRTILVFPMQSMYSIITLPLPLFSILEPRLRNSSSRGSPSNHLQESQSQSV